MEAKRTQLIELLERVPRDAVLVVEHDQFSSSSHPVGRLCHEAAAALEAAHADQDVMREALKDADNELDWLDEEIDTCDHSVGVCTCSYWGMRRKMKAALAKESSND